MQVEKTWLPSMINFDGTKTCKKTYPYAGGSQTPGAMLQHVNPWHLLRKWSYLDQIKIHTLLLINQASHPVLVWNLSVTLLSFVDQEKLLALARISRPEEEPANTCVQSDFAWNTGLPSNRKLHFSTPSHENMRKKFTAPNSHHFLNI